MSKSIEILKEHYRNAMTHWRDYVETVKSEIPIVVGDDAAAREFLRFVNQPIDLEMTSPFTSWNFGSGYSSKRGKHSKSECRCWLLQNVPQIFKRCTQS